MNNKINENNLINNHAIEIENITKTTVCSKGNILLTSYNYPENNLKAYQLIYNFNKLNPKKVNIKTIFSNNIYNLLEKMNSDLIEKIYILNIINDNETDILILFKNIAKDVGIKPKYLLFRSIRHIDYDNNTICFINKDISFIDDNLIIKYLNQVKLDTNKYENMIFNYGKIDIVIKNLQNNNLTNLLEENVNYKIDMNFKMDFQILINDYLPTYMENFIGLMFKKLFYNIKQFIDTLNTNL